MNKLLSFRVQEAGFEVDIIRIGTGNEVAARRAGARERQLKSSEDPDLYMSKWKHMEGSKKRDWNVCCMFAAHTYVGVYSSILQRILFLARHVTSRIWRTRGRACAMNRK